MYSTLFLVNVSFHSLKVLFAQKILKTLSNLLLKMEGN